MWGKKEACQPFSSGILPGATIAKASQVMVQGMSLAVLEADTRV